MDALPNLICMFSATFWVVFLDPAILLEEPIGSLELRNGIATMGALVIAFVTSMLGFGEKLRVKDCKEDSDFALSGHFQEGLIVFDSKLKEIKFSTQ